MSRDGTIDAGCTARKLRRCLPDFMLPSHFVVLPVLPLLPNGKLDRLSLPPPAEVAETQPRDFPTPAGSLLPAEQAVAAIWRRLLHVEHISRRDNFFDLGGHSLLAAQASSLIERELGFRVGVPRPSDGEPGADRAAAGRPGGARARAHFGTGCSSG